MPAHDHRNQARIWVVDDDRSTRSAFLEVGAPITNPKMNIPGAYSLDLTAGYRMEYLSPGSNTAKTPKIGILWKSNITKDARHRYFAGFDAWEPVLRQLGVTFVNLQYGDCAEELAHTCPNCGGELVRRPRRAAAQ